MSFKVAITIILIMLHLTATKLFGWNFLPASAEEVIVDIVVLFGLVLLWGKWEN